MTVEIILKIEISIPKKVRYRQTLITEWLDLDTWSVTSSNNNYFNKRIHSTQRKIIDFI